MANRCWVWRNAVPNKLCDLILEERKNLQEAEAGVGNLSVNRKFRDSKVSWLPTGHWLEGILCNFGINANNQSGWNFELSTPENVQLTRYQKGGYYNFHNDTLLLDDSLIRKVSVVLLLNETSEFEGGKFEFEDEAIELSKGTLIAFPSFINHRVTPVTEGDRYSAVCWVNGPRK